MITTEVELIAEARVQYWQIVFTTGGSGTETPSTQGRMEKKNENVTTWMKTLQVAEMDKPMLDMEVITVIKGLRLHKLQVQTD